MLCCYNQTYKIENINYFLHLFDYPIYFKHTYESFVNVEINSTPEINNTYQTILNATNSDLHKHIMIPYIDSWLYVNSHKKQINNIINPYYNVIHILIIVFKRKKIYSFFTHTHSNW